MMTGGEPFNGLEESSWLCTGAGYGDMALHMCRPWCEWVSSDMVEVRGDPQRMQDL